jgi:FAD:protein FMN transferase
VTVHGSSELLDEVTELVHELDRKWTRFAADSEVSRINAGAGSPVTVSPETVLLAGLALVAWTETHGRYDPTVLPALIAAGYDRDFASITGHGVEPGAACPGIGCSGIAVDARKSTVTVPVGCAVDFGGLAKGLAADLVVTDLLDGGAIGACVNIGGDVRVAGVSPRHGGWLVGVDDPQGQVQSACLRLTDGAVATTSRVNRSWGPADDRRHHIIDPRTGRPADSGLQTVTVATDEGWRAEALATAAFLAGPDEAPDVLAAVGASGFLVHDDGSTTAAGRWQGLLV